MDYVTDPISRREPCGARHHSPARKTILNIIIGVSTIPIRIMR